MNGVILAGAPPRLPHSSSPQLMTSRYPRPVLYSSMLSSPNPGYSKSQGWLLVRCTEGIFKDTEKMSLWQKVTKNRYRLAEMC